MDLINRSTEWNAGARFCTRRQAQSVTREGLPEANEAGHSWPHRRVDDTCRPSASCSSAAASTPACGPSPEACSSGEALPLLYHLISSWTAEAWPHLQENQHSSWMQNRGGKTRGAPLDWSGRDEVVVSVLELHVRRNQLQHCRIVQVAS